MVHTQERFEIVKVIFPIRGHSYLECDKNMSLVNTKSYTETPEEWRDVLKNSRIKPSPFKVVDCADEVNFQNWTEYLSQFYVSKCPMQTRPIRIIKIEKTQPRFVLHKPNFFGSYQTAVIVPSQKPKRQLRAAPRRANPIPLKKIYNGPLPIKAAKLKDLLHLAQFLVNLEAKNFYRNLKLENT